MRMALCSRRTVRVSTLDWLTWTRDGPRPDLSLTASEGRLSRVRDSPLLAAVPDPDKVWEVTAQKGRSGEEVVISYSGLKVVGSGSFGVVCSAKMIKGGRGQLHASSASTTGSDD
jgi:hypothetical protein